MFFATPVKFFPSLIESPLVNISSVSVTKLVDVERKIQDGYDGFLHLTTCPRSHGMERLFANQEDLGLILALSKWFLLSLSV